MSNLCIVFQTYLNLLYLIEFGKIYHPFGIFPLRRWKVLFYIWLQLLFERFEAIIFHFKLMTYFGIEKGDGAKSRDFLFA